MIVEPFANDDVKDNHNPIGRIYYSASTLFCTPAPLSQEVGMALGAGEAKIREVVERGGKPLPPSNRNDIQFDLRGEALGEINRFEKSGMKGVRQ